MRNANCKLCRLHEHATTVCINGDGPTDADILVVGQNPGQQEDRKGKPFIGPSGKLLKSQIAKADLGDMRIRYTNIVRCLSPDNREPTAKEIKACKPYLDAEIARVDPRYIVPLGAPATKAVAKAKVSTAHGQMIGKDGRVIVPSYHPAATFRDPSKLQVIQQDFARLKRHIDGTLGATQDKFQYRVVTDRSVLREFFEAFDAADEYAYDTETNGLIHAAPGFLVRCIAFAFEDCSWVIPLEMPGSLYANDYPAQAEFFRVVARKAADKWAAVFHGKFDAGAIRRVYNVSLPYHFDAMLAHYLLDENQDHDLKYVSRVELDCEEYDLPKELKLSDTPQWSVLMQNIENRNKYWKYNARDAWNTLHLVPRFAKRLRRNPALQRLFNELVMPSSYALEAIEARGLPLDLEQYRAMEIRVELERDESAEKLNKLAGRRINWNSRDQIAVVLFDDLGLPVMARTPTGAPSTSEEAVVDLKGKHPIINELLHYRELDKILGTYLQGWRKKGHVIKDKLYLSYKQPGTVTGRFSSRLHQIPTDGEIRSIIALPDGTPVARDWQFVAADLSQAELRIAAEMSGDPSLIEAYRSGRDVHWDTVLYMVAAGHMDEYADQAFDTAREIQDQFYVANAGKYKKKFIDLSTALEVMRIAGVDNCKKLWKGWKDARDCAKRINFGFLYGMYENTFIEKAKVDYDWMCTWKQAHAYRQGFFEQRRGLEPWHERCKKLARIDGQVTDMFGRIRRLPAIQSSDKLAKMEAERQAINAPVQGTIGDWKAAAMVEIHETIDSAKYRLCGEHHDALLGLVRRGYEDEVLPKVRRIMERPRLLKTFRIRMKVPMVVDVNVGPWGKGAAYHDPN
jgi:DNA polymerase-1